jgi:hypothetical protein
VSNLKLNKGDVLKASTWNAVIDRLPESVQGSVAGKLARVVLCKTLEEIAAATIDATITDSVYESGEVQVYGLVSNGDGTYSPALTTAKGIMINPSSTEAIPIDTELWAEETNSGVLVAIVWPC